MKQDWHKAKQAETIGALNESLAAYRQRVVELEIKLGDLKDVAEQNKALKAQLEDLVGRHTDASRRQGQAEERARSADKARDEAMRARDELKSQLADAIAEISRQRGYLDRVREDDVIHDLGPAVDQPRISRRGMSSAPEPYHDLAAGYSGRRADWWNL